MIHYAYAEDTVEEAIADLVVNRMVAMDTMAGDDAGMFDAMAERLRRERRGDERRCPSCG